MSAYTSTPQTTHFARMCRINVDLLRDLMLEIAIKEIPVVGLCQAIQSVLPVQTNTYTRTHKLLAKLLNLPNGRPLEKTDCDIGILYTLIRNVCTSLDPPTQGWGKVPTSYDVKVADDVERIRQGRNQVYGHTEVASIPDVDYQNQMTDLRQIIGRLDIHLHMDFTSGLNVIDTDNMDIRSTQYYIDALKEKKVFEQEILLKIESLEEDLCNQSADMTDHKQQFELLKVEVAGLQEGKDVTHEHLADLLTKLGRFEAKIALTLLEVEKRIGRQELKSEESFEKLNSLTEQVDSLKSDETELREKVAQLDGKVAELERLTSGEQKELLRGEIQLAEHLRHEYQTERHCAVTVLSETDDVLLSDIFTPITIREDMETRHGDMARYSLHSINPNVQQRRKKDNRSIQSYKDIFFKNGTPQNNIYLIGTAGSGKTSFCTHITELWSCPNKKARYKDAEVLMDFEFVFHVLCRFASQNDTLLDMICNQLVNRQLSNQSEVVHHVLKTKPAKCLILIDGLDEWAASPTEDSGPRGIPGLPSRAGIEGCVILTTSRPWRIQALRQGLGADYRILEVQGLEDVNETTEKILAVLEEHTEGQRKDEFDSYVKKQAKVFLFNVRCLKMNQLIQTPLMLINILTTWQLNKSLGVSICKNYCNMMEALIQRAKGKSGRTYDKNRLTEANVANISELEAQWERSPAASELPDCFKSTRFCNLYAPLILKLSELAFHGLFQENKEKSLVFSPNEIKSFLSEEEQKICLIIGILSQTVASSSSRTRLMSISFIHKTIQEFLAALYMATFRQKANQENLIDPMAVFQKTCRSMCVLFDLETFVIFFCGLAPIKGKELFQFIADEISGKDHKVIAYRNELCEYRRLTAYPEVIGDIVHLQEIMTDCTKEGRLGLSTSSFSHNLHYFLSDIFIGDEVLLEVRDTIFAQVLAYASRLQSLVMADGTELPDEVIWSLSQMADLRRLHLQPTDQKVFRGLYRMKNLRSLFLMQAEYDGTKGETCSSSPGLVYQAFTVALWYVPFHGAFNVPLPQHLTAVSITDAYLTSLDLALPKKLSTLYLRGIKMDHRNISQLCAFLKAGSLLETLHLENLMCLDHDKSCRYKFNLCSHRKLATLELIDLDVEQVNMEPENLESLHIKGLQSKGVVGVLMYVALFSTTLTTLKINNVQGELTEVNNSEITYRLPNLHQLQYLALSYVTFSQRYLELSKHMNKLKGVELNSVKMSPDGWQSFVISLPTPCDQSLEVKMRWCNIDQTGKYSVRVSPQFTITVENCQDFIFRSSEPLQKRN